ncbi:MAG: DUF6088 family protein [Rikenellaceae bacterium]
MKVSDIITNTINRFPIGYVFTYNDFNIEVTQKEAAIKHLNRLVQNGKLAKLSKGKYYKPEQTRFGQLPVSEYQVVKDLLEQDGRVIGYITGYRAYNMMHLTTQVPNTIHIGTNKFKNPTVRGVYKIKFVVQNNTITKESIPLLRFLDAIKNIKKIPGTLTDEAVVILLGILRDLSQNELQNIKRLSMKYTPATRALLGAMVESIYPNDNLSSLYETLNPITKYKLGVSQDALQTKERWNII